MRGAIILLAAVSVVVGSVAACVGDDPAPTPIVINNFGPDASSSGTTASGSSGTSGDVDDADSGSMTSSSGSSEAGTGSFDCTSAKDCSVDDLCCVRLARGPDAGRTLALDSACKRACETDSNERRVCQTNNDCTPGRCMAGELLEPGFPSPVCALD